MLSQRLQKLRPTAVNAILAEVRQLQERGIQPISLMRGEPDFATPSHIVEAVIDSFRDGRTAYPNNQGEPPLREAVADTLSKRFGVQYDPQDQVLITTGATLGVHATLCCVLDEGDEVLLPEPVYDAYHSVVFQAGGIPRSVPATISDNRFVWNADDVGRACDGGRVKVLLLNTPWNPTGGVFTTGL